MAAFLQELLNKLQATLAATQLPSCISMELEKLSVVLTSLEDAEKKPNKKRKDVESWLYELQQAAYDAHDFLNCLPLRVRDPEENDVQKVVLQQTELIIKDIRRRVEKLMEERPPYDEIHLHLQQSDDMHSEIPNLGTPPEEVRVVGRDEDREEMIQLLTSEESSQMDISLIAVVGRGGVGKTTFARLVYEDERVTSHFPLKFWVAGSEIHDTPSLCRSIHQDEDEKNQFAARRFLLVLEDFCFGVIEWDRLCEHLGTEPRRSKIVITVEDEKIAKNMGLRYLFYHPKDLNHGDCWSLFKEYACLDLGTGQVSREFEQVGMEIADKLERLPLAARMIGCLLRSNSDLNNWKMILNADVWKAKPDELHGIPAALWLSYQHLPSHIKQCFAYCSVFPRGHIFNKEDLIHMWIAQGLIQPQEGTRMEDSGSEYFDYLVRRSFFQSIGPDYVMHNMILKLAMAITRGESLRLSGGADKSHEDVERTQRNHEIQRKKARYLYLQSDCLPLSEVLGLSMLGDIETLVFYGTNEASFNYDSLFKKLTSIRVLYLCDKGLNILPKSIAELKQLRYLNLCETSIGMAPEQVCHLFNLQTLKLNRFHSIFHRQRFPEKMSKLINLRHLNLEECNIPKVGRLTCLQHLEEFTSSREEGYKIEELKYMNQIRGSLALRCLDNVHTEEEAKEAALNDKEHLDYLSLSWRSHDVSEEEKVGVFEALKPHPNLKNLLIVRNMETKTPSWLEDGSLRNLEALTISQCHNLDLLLLGQLQSLKSLWVAELTALIWLGPRFSNGGDDVLLFPRLTQLHIRNCLNLTELIPLPPTLEMLKLEQVGLQVLPGCQQSRSSTPSFSLTSVHISGCHRLVTLQVGLLARQNQHLLEALTSLTILRCEELLHLPDHGFSALKSLKYLHIESCKNLIYKPTENKNGLLPSTLIELTIIDCPHLTSLSHDVLQQMKALTQLNISHCVGLELLGFQSLKSLKTLNIAGCPKLAACSSLADTSPLLLESLDIRQSSLLMLTGELLSRLAFLRVLKLVNYFEQACFPKSMDEGLHCLVSLQELHIYECYNLRALPDELASIPFLKELYVIECPRLERLPDKGVPRSLQLLVMEGCRNLMQRCFTGCEDWPKISHVFYVQIRANSIRHSHRWQESQIKTSTIHRSPRL